MYRIAVVDDELDVRSRIISILKQINNEFNLIGEYDNGLDAKEGILNDPPDILITDIRIPYLDGIELSRIIKEQGLETKIIIITGFDVFDYAKKAIEYGVSSFISKPITKDELASALNKVCKQIDEEYTLNATLDRLNKFHRESIDIIKNNDLNLLVSQNKLEESLIVRLSRDNIDLNCNSIAFALVDYDKTSTEIDFNGFEATTYTLYKHFAEFSYQMKYHIFTRNDRLVVLILSDNDISRSKLEKIFNPILNILIRNYKISFSVGISNVSHDKLATNFRDLYQNSVKALDYRSIIGGNQIIFFNDIYDQEFKFTSLDENAYKQLIYDLNYENIDTVKNYIIELFSKISSKEYHLSYYYITLNILNSIIKGCSSLSRLYKNYMPHSEILKKFTQLKTTSETEDFIIEVAQKVYDVNQEVKVNSTEKNYQMILNYLNSHYRDIDISLESVSEEVSLSVSYISFLFKAHDTSFVKCLTTLRIEKAKELLRDPNNKIIDIAEYLGYNDPYYFSHCFKKATGLSPREFKNSDEK